MLPSPPDKIPLAQLPTPLHPLTKLSEYLGGPSLWIKRDDLTGTTLTGNKVRKLEYLLAQAQQQGAHILLTCGGVQSNHCRATALVAAQLGMQCHLLLRGEQPEVLDGNTLLAHLAGATTTFYPPDVYRAELDELFAHWSDYYRSLGLEPYVIPTGASNGVGLWGYLQAAQELLADCAAQHFQPDLICCATGSGGTHTGLALGMHQFAPEVAVRGYAVCDSAAYFREKAVRDLTDWQRTYAPEQSVPLMELDVNEEYMGAGYGLADASVYRAIQLLAKLEGVILDPVYTGKAFAGLIDEIKQGKLSKVRNVVFIHTGGIYGVFPYRDNLAHLP